MIEVRILNQGNLLDVVHYHNHQNAIAALHNKSIFREHLSEDVLEKVANCDDYTVVSCGEKLDGTPEDCEYQFSNGICVYIGTIFYEDED